MIVFFLGSVKVGCFYIFVDVFILVEWIVKIIESLGVELFISVLGDVVDMGSNLIKIVIFEEFVVDGDVDFSCENWVKELDIFYIIYMFGSMGNLKGV